jgi:membrane protease YdiL (CAAX protease family)
VLFIVAVITNYYVGRQVIICHRELGLLLAGTLTATVAFVSLFLVPRDRLLDVFSLKKCSWKCTIGAALLAPSIVALARHANMLQALAPFPDGTSGLPQVLGIFPIGLAQAIVVSATVFYPLGRELLFRGAFQGLLQGTFDRFGLPIAIALLSGICQTDSACFMAAATLGFGFSLIVTWSRSIYPGMALHVLTVLLVATGAWRSLTAEQLVAIGVVSLVVGLLLLWSGRPSEQVRAN